MSDRERWIVYPLLFLTLGMVMRDKLFPQRGLRTAHESASRVPEGVPAEYEHPHETLTVERIHCKELKVDRYVDAAHVSSRKIVLISPQATEAVRLGVTPSGSGRMEIANADGKPLVVVGVDQTERLGTVETLASSPRRP